MDPQTWWYIARASGLVAWSLTSAAVVWGLALAGRPLGRQVAPAWLYDLHEHLGGLSVTFTAVHVAGLIADTTVTFTLLDVLVPFAADWRPLPVALGVTAWWLLLAIELTSLLRRRLSTRMWRRVHQASLPLWGLATAHLMTAGTDASNPIVTSLVVVTAAGVAFLLTYRIASRRPRPRSRRVSTRPGPGSSREPALR